MLPILSKKMSVFEFEKEIQHSLTCNLKVSYAHLESEILNSIQVDSIETIEDYKTVLEIAELELYKQIIHRSPYSKNNPYLTESISSLSVIFFSYNLQLGTMAAAWPYIFNNFRDSELMHKLSIIYGRNLLLVAAACAATNIYCDFTTQKIIHAQENLAITQYNYESIKKLISLINESYEAQ
jgi:hypothetical protein